MAQGRRRRCDPIACRVGGSMHSSGLHRFTLCNQCMQNDCQPPLPSLQLCRPQVCRRSDAAVAVFAAKASPTCESPEALQPTPTPSPAAAAIAPASPAAQQAAKADSSPKPFEAKLAALEAEEELPTPPAASPACRRLQQAATPQQQQQQRQNEQPESLEHARDGETEESIAAATLLELPRPQSSAALPAASTQRRPMGELDSNRAAAAAACESRAHLHPKQRRKSGLLNAAWAASGIVKRPPQQKRSARRPPPVTRIVSPHLLSQFPERPPRPATPPAAAPLAAQMQMPSTAQLPAVNAVPALVTPASAAPQQQAPQQPAALPRVSAPLPELPPIAPLDLQPMRLQLAADVPPLPAAHSAGSAHQQAAPQVVVRLAQPIGSAQHLTGSHQAGASWAAAGPFTVPSQPAPLKRPGDRMDMLNFWNV